MLLDGKYVGDNETGINSEEPDEAGGEIDAKVALFMTGYSPEDKIGETHKKLKLSVAEMW